MSTPDGKRAPILISGCPRSGTTFLGSVFEASKDCFEIYEPFNSDFTYHLDLPSRFYRITPENGSDYRRQVDRLVALSTLTNRLMKLPRGLIDRLRAHKDVPSALALKKCVQKTRRFFSARRVVFKDPIAFFSASWLAETYDANVVLMLRHPGGVISSYLALDWKAETPELIEHMMPSTRARLAAEIEHWQAHPEDRIGELILQWKIFTVETLTLAEANPDWHVVSHEYLCDHPEEVFSTLFDAFGLDFSEQVQTKILDSTGAGNIVDPKEHTQHNLNRQSKTLKDSWKKRLDADTIDRITNEAEPLWKEAFKRFYPAEGCRNVA
jgi:hypothetical protein